MFPSLEPRTLLRALGLALVLGMMAACSHDTKRNVDQAHEQFKQDVKPIAKRVDDTTNDVVNEGKKAAHKVANAVDGDSDEAPAKPSN